MFTIAIQPRGWNFFGESNAFLYCNSEALVACCGDKTESGSRGRNYQGVRLRETGDSVCCDGYCIVC